MPQKKKTGHACNSHELPLDVYKGDKPEKAEFH